MSSKVVLPHLAGEYFDSLAAFMASDEEKLTQLRKLYDYEEVDFDSTPAPFQRSPLMRWVYLVITINHITPKYLPNGEADNLASHGIDLGFSDIAIRKFAWYLA